MDEGVPETPVRRRMKELSWPKTKETVELGRNAIEKLVPHRFLHLPLDTVTIEPGEEGRIIGRFDVVAGFCLGFPKWRKERLILTEGTIIQMATLTAGLGCSARPELTKRLRVFETTALDVIRFRYPVRATDNASVIIYKKKVVVKEMEKDCEENDRYSITARGIFVQIGPVHPSNILTNAHATLGRIRLVSSIADEEYYLRPEEFLAKHPELK